MAAHMESGEVASLELHDPTGTREMSLGGIAMRFRVEEKRH